MVLRGDPQATRRHAPELGCPVKSGIQSIITVLFLAYAKWLTGMWSHQELRRVRLALYWGSNCMSHACHTTLLMGHQLNHVIPTVTPHHICLMSCHIEPQRAGIQSSVCLATRICRVLGPGQPSPTTLFPSPETHHHDSLSFWVPEAAHIQRSPHRKSSSRPAKPPR